MQLKEINETIEPNMSLPCKSSSSDRTVRALCCALVLLIVGPGAHPQTELDRAHALLDEMTHLQKHERDKPTTEALTSFLDTGPQQIEDLLNRGFLALLNSPGRHNTDQLRQKLTAALQVAPPEQYSPEVFVFSSSPKNQPTYFVAYNFGYCAACSRNWIGVFGRVGGVYRILASVENPFPNHSLNVTWLPQAKNGEPRLLAYGTNWGDPHNRLSVTAFTFADSHFRREWSLTDLPQGTVEVLPREIIVSYLTSLRPPWAERTEVYAILPEQIQLRESSEHPNP
jgi:hypothetical protein